MARHGSDSEGGPAPEEELIRRFTSVLHQFLQNNPKIVGATNHGYLCGSRFYGHKRRQVCKRRPEVWAIRLAVLVTLAVVLLVVLIYQP